MSYLPFVFSSPRYVNTFPSGNTYSGNIGSCPFSDEMAWQTIISSLKGRTFILHLVRPYTKISVEIWAAFSILCLSFFTVGRFLLSSIIILILRANIANYIQERKQMYICRFRSPCLYVIGSPCLYVIRPMFVCNSTHVCM